MPTIWQRRASLPMRSCWKWNRRSPVSSGFPQARYAPRFQLLVNELRAEELAAANFGGNSITVLRNNGMDIVSSLSPTAGQVGVSALSAGDRTGNRSLYMAAADNGCDNVHILDYQP